VPQIEPIVTRQHVLRAMAVAALVMFIAFAAVYALMLLGLAYYGGMD
jgi:hypothetical protein